MWIFIPPLILAVALEFVLKELMPQMGREFVFHAIANVDRAAMAVNQVASVVKLVY